MCYFWILARSNALFSKIFVSLQLFCSFLTNLPKSGKVICFCLNRFLQKQCMISANKIITIFRSVSVNNRIFQFSDKSIQPTFLNRLRALVKRRFTGGSSGQLRSRSFKLKGCACLVLSLQSAGSGGAGYTRREVRDHFSFEALFWDMAPPTKPAI